MCCVCIWSVLLLVVIRSEVSEFLHVVNSALGNWAAASCTAPCGGPFSGGPPSGVGGGGTGLHRATRHHGGGLAHAHIWRAQGGHWAAGSSGHHRKARTATAGEQAGSPGSPTSPAAAGIQDPGARAESTRRAPPGPPPRRRISIPQEKRRDGNPTGPMQKWIAWSKFWSPGVIENKSD